MAVKITPGAGGEYYIPYENRTGAESIVYFTRDLSAEGLRKVYRKLSSVLCGKVAVKLHTGEKNGPNIIPRPWVKELMADRLPGAAIVETNRKVNRALIGAALSLGANVEIIDIPHGAKYKKN